MRPKPEDVEVVSMAYRSPAFLRFTWEQMREYVPPGVAIRVVLNDPTPEVVEASKGMNVTVYNDPKPDDWYISRCYRAWNHTLEHAKHPWICFVNSDMAYSPLWLEALMELSGDPGRIVTSRLVESGRIPVGRHAIPINFGMTPSTFHKEGWLCCADELRHSGFEPGGLYMPALIHREEFLARGGYPEGNVADGKVVNRMPLTSDRVYEPGDAAKFREFDHITAMGSLVYHMQEGERRE